MNTATANSNGTIQNGARALTTRLSTMVDGAVRVARPTVIVLTRFLVGYVFLRTGFLKLTHFSNVVQFFTDLGLPVPGANAALVSTLEFVGGLAILAGAGTRVFSLLLVPTMVVALLTADRERFLGAFSFSADHSLTDVAPVPLLALLLWLAAGGAGRLSVDALLANRRRAMGG